MNLDIIHEHLQQIMKTKTSSIIAKPTTIDPSMTLSQVISRLSNSDVFDAFYRHKNSTLTVNIRDLLQSKNITHMNVDQLLHPIQSLSENDTIEDAVNIITHNRTRAAPVVKDDEIIGAVKAKDILKLVSELDNRWIKANQFFTPNPIVIDKQTPLSTARRIMTSKRIDHLPIINKDTVSHVLTSYHVLQTILPDERVGKRDIGSRMIRGLESPVGNLGTSRMPNCSPLDDLTDVLSAMLHANTTFCLVSLRTGLQGIITYRDILNLLVTKEKSIIPFFIIGMPKEDNTVILTDKFKKVIERLSKVYTDVQEARVYVKKIHGGGSRYNYEVSTVILTPIKRYIFSRSGFDLSKVFDEISGRILRNLSKRAKKRNKLSIRKMM
jgi:CBS domain-containing protein